MVVPLIGGQACDGCDFLLSHNDKIIPNTTQRLSYLQLSLDMNFKTRTLLTF